MKFSWITHARARWIVLLTIAAASIGFVYLTIRWVHPKPETEEILKHLTGRAPEDPPNFLEANRAAKVFLETRGGESIAKLFYYFPEEGAPAEPAQSSPYWIVPRGRVFQNNLPMMFHDPRKDAKTHSYFAVLEVEGREIRSYGPSALGATMMPLSPPSESFGPEGATGRIILMDQSGPIAKSAFGMLSPAEKATVESLLISAKILSKNNAHALRYLTATTTAAHGCFGDSLIEILNLLNAFPTNPTLLQARNYLYYKIATVYPNQL
ncbi:MAG: hypothetical protein ACKVS6_02380 [Planctomycetota bacterium]